jgi:hypothetical protein
MLALGHFDHYDWNRVPVTQHPGDTGIAFQQALCAGPFRVRKVRYSSGYRADHWCGRGHIVLVLAGSAKIDFDNGRSAHIDAGHVFWMSDGDGLHRTSSNGGVELYIIDEH